MDTASRPARQPRISWLTPQKKKKREKNLSDPSGWTIKNETLVCTRKKGMLGNLTIQTSGVSISLRVETGSWRADIRWFVFDCHCELLEGSTRPSAGQLGQSDTTGLKKANRGKTSGAFKRERHPNIKHSNNLTRSSLSLSHEPAWKLSGLVNGETPSASLSAVPTV